MHTPVQTKYVLCNPTRHQQKSNTPQMLKYKLALQLYKLYNNETQTKDWLTLSFNQNFNERNTKANFIDTSNYKIGKNILPNRLPFINNLIEYDWLNYEKEIFKLMCKDIFLRI